MKRIIRETKQEYEPTTAEEKQDRRNEMKAEEEHPTNFALMAHISSGSSSNSDSE
ncbi:hypothetical protein Tco_1340751, partial [Tanacetum coccineum]